MLLWFGLSVWLFSVSERLEYAVAPLLERPPPEVNPTEWGWVESALFSLRLHVPIISLGDGEEFQPHGIGMRAYSVVTVALHWAMWPLLIASVSGIVRRRT